MRVICIAFSTKDLILPRLTADSVRWRGLGVELARLVTIAVLAAAAAMPSTHATGPRAAPLSEPAPLETPVSAATAGSDEAATRGAHPLDAAAVGPGDVAPHGERVEAWFDDAELKVNAAGGDKSDMLIDPDACVYPDSFLRNLAGGRDDCGFLKPGPDQSAILTWPFFALSGWIVVICTVAVLYLFGREWRARRWLRRMRAQGLAPNAPYPRRLSHRRPRRSGRHRGAEPRRYAG